MVLCEYRLDVQRETLDTVPINRIYWKNIGIFIINYLFFMKSIQRLVCYDENIIAYHIVVLYTYFYIFIYGRRSQSNVGSEHIKDIQNCFQSRSYVICLCLIWMDRLKIEADWFSCKPVIQSYNFLCSFRNHAFLLIRWELNIFIWCQTVQNICSLIIAL